MGSIPGVGRSPGEGNGSLLQYSCLGNLMDRRAGRAIVYTVTRSQQQGHQETLYFCLLPCLSRVWTAVTMNRSSINFLFSALIFFSGSLFQKPQNYNLINKHMGLTILFYQGKYIFSKHVMIRNSIRQLLDQLYPMTWTYQCHFIPDRPWRPELTAGPRQWSLVAWEALNCNVPADGDQIRYWASEQRETGEPRKELYWSLSELTSKPEVGREAL